MKWWKICCAVNTFGKITDHEFLVKVDNAVEAFKEANIILLLDARILYVENIDEDVF